MDLMTYKLIRDLLPVSTQPWPLKKLVTSGSIIGGYKLYLIFEKEKANYFGILFYYK